MFLTIIYFINCVESSIVPLIVGGKITSTTVYPYQAFLDIHGEEDWICGGSFLNQALILTAAHCLEDLSKSNEPKMLIKYGSESLRNAKLRRMKSYKIHPKYDFETMFADLAMVQCRRPVILGDNVQRVTIMRNPPVELYAYVSGWGVVDEAMSSTEVLKHVKQKIYPSETCRKLYLPNGTFCAGYTGALKDFEYEGYPSLGDSGGPLVIGNFVQIGIVSYRVKGYTAVAYTNVSFFMRWIECIARVKF